jgi:hypothetical protein
VPDVRNTIPPPSGRRSRYCSRESGSGFVAISRSAMATIDPTEEPDRFLTLTGEPKEK